MGKRLVLTFTVVCASLAACLSDLPPGTKCPADPQRVVGDCGQTLASTMPVPGSCLSQVAHECLLGPRTDCSCNATECPDTAAACNPGRECPAAVRSAAPGATCPKLSDAQTSPCACGCARCLALCDGYGPSLGVVVVPGPGAPGQPIVVIPLGGLLPASGKLGFYVRLRGVAMIGAGFAFGPTLKVDDRIEFSDFQASGTEFHDAMIGVTGPAKASWSTPADAPTSIVLAALPASGTNAALTYAQIDCVIPVILP